MADMRCDKCRFWNPNDGEVGECRRFPPRLDKNLYSNADLPKGTDGFFGWFVRTDGGDWCGEFQPISQKSFSTIGQLAERYHQPEWKVRRVVDSLSSEIPRAGKYRMVPNDLLPAIEAKLHNSAPGEEGKS